MEVNLTMGNHLLAEMSNINTSLKSYPGYERIASSLSKLIPQPIVAGLIGCIIPESGTNHRILNKKEYNGGGVSGTEGWNCGEGLIQWTYWKYKEPLIRKYNADSRSRQKLPTTWEEYSQGEPHMQGNILVADSDGRHIAGLSLDDQMVFLVIYYSNLIKQLGNENNIALITAKIYQQKAGVGFYKDISDPVEKAYTTAKNKYKSSSGNHFLKSLKLAQEYCGIESSPVDDIIRNDGVLFASNNTSSNPKTNKVHNFMNVKDKDAPFSGILLGANNKQI